MLLLNIFVETDTFFVRILLIQKHRFLFQMEIFVTLLMSLLIHF